MKNQQYLQVGKRIAMFRNERRLTQNDLAEKLNTSQQVISHLERDEAGNTTLGRLVEVADALEVDLNALIGTENTTVNITGNNETQQLVAYNHGTLKMDFPQKLMEQYEGRISDLQQQLSELREMWKGIDKKN